MGRKWTYSKNERQQMDQAMHRVATKDREKIKRTTKQKVTGRQNKEGGNHAEQDRIRQMQMEGILQWMDKAKVK